MRSKGLAGCPEFICKSSASADQSQSHPGFSLLILRLLSTLCRTMESSSGMSTLGFFMDETKGSAIPIKPKMTIGRQAASFGNRSLAFLNFWLVDGYILCTVQGTH